VSHPLHDTVTDTFGADFAQFPTSGRVFATTRKVRLGDVTPRGRLRLDAVARYLQDIATDDALDGNFDDPHSWVVRRTDVVVHQFASYLNTLQLQTWCGGVGSHWAERRTRISLLGNDPSNAQPIIEAATLWVRVDLQTLKPLALSDSFRQSIGTAANNRKVSARLLVGRGLPASDTARDLGAWQLRFSDFDAVGHLNNAVYWEPLEEYLGTHREHRAPLRAIVEHHLSVESGAEMHVAVHELGERVVIRETVGAATAALVELRSTASA
jgi:acyl-ACP thioesterase